MAEAKAAQFYVVATAGPLSLTLRDSSATVPPSGACPATLDPSTPPAETGTTSTPAITGTAAKQYRVSLGARQSCTCPGHVLTGELCHHLLWVMLRVFRVPEQADLLYQLALTEREVEGLLEFQRIAAGGAGLGRGTHGSVARVRRAPPGGSGRVGDGGLKGADAG
jgi:hypothetical protein